MNAHRNIVARTIVLAGAAGGTVIGQTEIRHHIGDPLVEMDLGRWVAAIGDIDSDGVEDYAASAPSTKHNGYKVGAVRVFSGASGNSLAFIKGKIVANYFGAMVEGIGDANLDGTPDFAFGDLGPQSTGAKTPTSSIRVLSGASFSVLWNTTNSQTGYQTGPIIRRIGDLDTDGLLDVAVSALVPMGSEPGVTVLSGGTGAVLKTITIPNNYEIHFFDGADVTGDGIPEIAIGNQNHLTPSLGLVGRVFLLDYATESPLWVVDGPSHGATFGAHLQFGNDVTGDGSTDLAVLSRMEVSPQQINVLSGAVRVLNGATGAVVSVYYPKQFGALQQYGSLDFRSDFDNDGKNDVLVGCAGEELLSGVAEPIRGIARVLDATTGTVQSTIVEPDGTAPFESCARWVASIGDLNQDGLSDILAGHSSSDDAGGLYVYGTVVNHGSATSLAAACTNSIGLQCGIAPTITTADLTAEGCFSPNGRAMLFMKLGTNITSPSMNALFATPFTNPVNLPLPGGCSLLVNPTFLATIFPSGYLGWVYLPVTMPATLTPATIRLQLASVNSFTQYNCQRISTSPILELSLQ